MPRRLTGMDAMFLSMEGGPWPQHTVGLMIMDPTEAKDLTFDSLREHMESRLPYIPQFRRVVQEVPLNLDRPIWVDDPNFNLDAHLFRAACPSPGGPRELADIVTHILSRPLERSRSLWQAWYIEGLEGGRVAFLAKTHHSMVDGVSGASLADVLCDISPDPATRKPPKSDEPEPRRGRRELLVGSAVHAVGNVPKMARFLAQSVGSASTTISHLRSDNPPPRPLSAPRTIFNGVISPRRQFAYTSLPMGDVKLVKNHFGATINDVIMTVVGGGIRTYLLDRDALPEVSVQATVPMSTRAGDDTGMGNQVHATVAELATDVADPIERLEAIHKGMSAVKSLAEDMTANENKIGLTQLAPPVLLHTLFTAYRDAGLEQKLPLQSNLIVSNVPGPPVPLYMAGAKIEHIYPVGPLNMGMGINITVFSYNGYVNMGVQSDPDLVDDAWAIIDAATAELQVLVDTANK